MRQKLHPAAENPNDVRWNTRTSGLLVEPSPDRVPGQNGVPHPDPEQGEGEGWDDATSSAHATPGAPCLIETWDPPQTRLPHPDPQQREGKGWDHAHHRPASRSITTSLLTAAFILLVIFGARAADTANGARYDKLSHRIMCPCSCNELLGECNHVGCPDSDKMRNQLAASIDRGEDDTAIFRAFQDQYGAVALAAPMFTRFNQFSWWVPPAVLLLGVGTVFAVVRAWRPQVAAMPAPATNPQLSALEDRVRRETGGSL